jgi:hypothetical protein
LIATELFWWLISRKYKLRRVVGRGGEKRFRVINLKVIFGGLVNACNERREKEVGQKEGIGEQEGKTAVECKEKKRGKSKNKTATSKLVRDPCQSFSSN